MKSFEEFTEEKKANGWNIAARRAALKHRQKELVAQFKERAKAAADAKKEREKAQEEREKKREAAVAERKARIADRQRMKDEIKRELENEKAGD